MKQKKVSLNVNPSTRDLVKMITAIRKISIYDWVDEKAQSDWAVLEDEMKNKLYS
jgi:hypothetical protein